MCFSFTLNNKECPTVRLESFGGAILKFGHKCCDKNIGFGRSMGVMNEILPVDDIYIQIQIQIQIQILTGNSFAADE